ncbi:ATP-binding cassette domain-containing protein [Streptomyces sp. NPDC047939]|uniref:ATP-binding cassette domain-containing protein n=1 Tax=Streptomyces sp. NPDC047939 TaxID=3155381 RepID=UPI00341C739B
MSETTNMTPGEPLLSARGIVLDYAQGVRRKPTRVLHGVDIEIAPGETLGLVGESGSGKSSLANIVLGFRPPTEGHIRFRGRDITGIGRRERRTLSSEIQAVFQDPYSSLNPTRRVGTSIAEPLLRQSSSLSRWDVTARVQDMLVRVGLPPDAADRYPAHFSGGQRQRIAIARALIINPSLVICDEPVSALDLSVQAQVLNLLAELQESMGLSYLFIAHDLAVVRFLSHRMAVMHKGRIVETGPAERVYSAPADPYTQRLLAAVPDPDPDNASLHRLTAAQDSR